MLGKDTSQLTEEARGLLASFIYQNMEFDTEEPVAQLLQQADGDTLQKAADLAAAGDFRKAGASLAPLLETPEIQALLRQLEK